MGGVGAPGRGQWRRGVAGQPAASSPWVVGRARGGSGAAALRSEDEAWRGRRRTVAGVAVDGCDVRAVVPSASLGASRWSTRTTHRPPPSTPRRTPPPPWRHDVRASLWPRRTTHRTRRSSSRRSTPRRPDAPPVRPRSLGWPARLLRPTPVPAVESPSPTWPRNNTSARHPRSPVVVSPGQAVSHQIADAGRAPLCAVTRLIAPIPCFPRDRFL